MSQKIEVLAAYGGEIKSPIAAELSALMDVPRDREWFRSHPGVTRRTRPPTALEKAAAEIRDDDVVVVDLLPGKVIARRIYGSKS